jgi:hypothetical protein
MSRTKESGHGAVATVGTIADELGALSSRLTIYAEHMPAQARWQAEYLLDERGFDSTNIALFLAEVSAMRTVFEALDPDSNGLPIYMRVDMANLQSQLQPHLDSIQALGQTAVDDLKHERKALTDFLRQERVVVMQDLEVMSARMMTTATDRLAQALTGWLWAGAPILLLLLAIPFWLGLLTGKIMLRRSG